jgi:ribonuclease BN (tRNA processing enzyme)
MIKLIFLGSGSAFTVGSDNFQSNVLLIDEKDNKLLLDCGSDIRFSLGKLGFSYLDITDIYISHLHSDHAGGLEYMGLSRKFDPRCSTTKLYLSREIATDLWQKTLAGGMEHIEGVTSEMADFFDVYSVAANSYFTWNDIRFYLLKTNHVDSGSCLMSSHGLFFNLKGKQIFFSGDTKLRFESLRKYYEEADIIFHDCETAGNPTPVHAHYQQLINLPEKIKNKIWLYGYQPQELPDAKKDGFRGFIKRGQSFEFEENSLSIFSYLGFAEKVF